MYLYNIIILHNFLVKKYNILMYNITEFPIPQDVAGVWNYN